MSTVIKRLLETQNHTASPSCHHTSFGRHVPALSKLVLRQHTYSLQPTWQQHRGTSDGRSQDTQYRNKLQGHSAKKVELPDYAVCHMLLVGWLAGPGQLNRDPLKSVSAFSCTTRAHPRPRPPRQAGRKLHTSTRSQTRDNSSRQASHSAQRWALPI